MVKVLGKRAREERRKVVLQYLRDAELGKEKEMGIEMQPVSSSLIAAVGHDAQTLTLFIQFKRGGETWQYEEVPRVVYDDMIGSDSVGRFFLAKVKHVYEGKKVGEEVKEKAGDDR